MQLSALTDEFLLDCRARRLSPRTITWYRSNLRYFLDWLAGEGMPDRLASFTLQQARRYSHMLAERSALQATFVSGGKKHGVHAMIETDRPLSANTVSGYLRTLKVFSRWLAAEEQGYLERHLLSGLRLPKRPQTHKEPLTPAEMERLLADYDLRRPGGVRDFTILLTYLGTGLRATELTALYLDDVHLEEGYLRVRSGKGNKTRAVNLPPEVARAMARYRQHYRPATVDPHLFVTSAGTPLTYNAIGQLLTRAKRASGIGRVHAHLLRHSFSVAALAGGMDLMTLKETLGHADIKTTSIYLNMSEQQLIAQQRKVNPVAGLTLPKAVRKKATG